MHIVISTAAASFMQQHCHDWFHCVMLQIDADYLLLKNIKLEDKHKPGASSITFWHSYQQRGIVQGATTLWDKRAEFQKKRPQFWLPVPSKCLVKI